MCRNPETSSSPLSVAAAAATTTTTTTTSGAHNHLNPLHLSTPYPTTTMSDQASPSHDNHAVNRLWSENILDLELHTRLERHQHQHPSTPDNNDNEDEITPVPARATRPINVPFRRMLKQAIFVSNDDIVLHDAWTVELYSIVHDRVVHEIRFDRGLVQCVHVCPGLMLMRETRAISLWCVKARRFVARWTWFPGAGATSKTTIVVPYTEQHVQEQEGERNDRFYLAFKKKVYTVQVCKAEQGSGGNGKSQAPLPQQQKGKDMPPLEPQMQRQSRSSSSDRGGRHEYDNVEMKIIHTQSIPDWDDTTDGRVLQMAANKTHIAVETQGRILVFSVAGTTSPITTTSNPDNKKKASSSSSSSSITTDSKVAFQFPFRRAPWFGNHDSMCLTDRVLVYFDNKNAQIVIRDISTSTIMSRSPNLGEMRVSNPDDDIDDDFDDDKTEMDTSQDDEQKHEQQQNEEGEGEEEEVRKKPVQARLKQLLQQQQLEEQQRKQFCFRTARFSVSKTMLMTKLTARRNKGYIHLYVVSCIPSGKVYFVHRTRGDFSWYTPRMHPQGVVIPRITGTVIATLPNTIKTRAFNTCTSSTTTTPTSTISSADWWLIGHDNNTLIKPNTSSSSNGVVITYQYDLTSWSLDQLARFDLALHNVERLPAKSAARLLAAFVCRFDEDRKDKFERMGECMGKCFHQRDVDGLVLADRNVVDAEQLADLIVVWLSEVDERVVSDVLLNGKIRAFLNRLQPNHAMAVAGAEEGGAGAQGEEGGGKGRRKKKKEQAVIGI